MQQSSRLAPAYDTVAPFTTSGSAAFWSYAGALLIGVTLLATTFPIDFLLGTRHLAQPPQGDIAQHIVGQRYFLADAWRWPAFQVPSLFAPQGTNIAFVDAIPLLAVPLKLAAPLLPPAFHGIGLWFAIAWLLQPVAAVWCLRGAGERRLLPALAVALAAASMPAWWDRFVHAALCGQFLILLALGLYLRLVAPSGRSPWALAALLLVTSLLVHPYLAFMVAALLAAAPLTLALRHDRRWRPTTLGVAACVALLLGAMALLGYFGAKGGTGFGIYAMDLLSPFWPAGSALFPVDLPRLDASGGPGDEGYNYLGAGLLLGLAAAMLRFRHLKDMVRRHPGLALVLVSLTLLALSQRVAVGGVVLLDLGPVPAWLENLRSTGRFFWPAAYAALVGSLLLAARRPDPRVAAALVTAIAALQFVDTAGLRAGLRERLHAPTATWLVDAPALRSVLAGQESLTLLPSWHCVPAADPVPEQRLLMNLLVLASEVGLPVSTMYLARWHGSLRCHDRQLAAAPLGRGEVRVLTPLAQAAYLPLVPRSVELCSPLGKLTICRDPASNGPPPTQLNPLTPRLAEGEVSFAATGSGTEMLGEGWSYPEHDGSWSVANQVPLVVKRPPKLAGPVRLEFDLEGMAPSAGRNQHVELWWNKAIIARWALPDRKRLGVSAVLPPGLPGQTELEFRVASPTRPIDRGLNNDGRRLGVKLYRMRVARDDGWPALSPGEITFGEGASGAALLGFGWSRPEEQAVWSEGEAAELDFVRPPQLTGPIWLEFELEGFAPSAVVPQEVELWNAQHRLARWELPDRRRRQVTAFLPPGPAGATSLRFVVASPARPVDRGLGEDSRWLGMRLWRLRVPAEPPAMVLQAGNYAFAAGDVGTKLLARGWAEPGSEGTSLSEQQAVLRFQRPASLAEPLQLTLELQRTLVGTTSPSIELWLWGRRLGRWAYGANERRKRAQVLIPAGPAEETEIELRVVGEAPSISLSTACIEPLRYRSRDAPCGASLLTLVGPS